ncbi:MAG: hypothetical protein KBG17_07700 [Paludibacteraceae bacterium]|nr:hypothetical protein [Paludibacteraceae bacterium]
MMSEIKQHIVLNFLPLSEQEFSFTVFRRLVQHLEKKWSDDIKRYNLPRNHGDTDNFTSYWVSFNQFENSESFTIEANTNNFLTEWYIHSLLLQMVSQQPSLIQYNHKSDFNELRTYFEIERFNEGVRTIWLEPYYLKKNHKFGFLIGFRFFLIKNQPFNKRVQQLSFSLDNDGRSNKNFHIDCFNYFKRFIGNFNNAINPISNNISISSSFEPIESDLLATKIYEFGNGKTSNSQFNGIMSNGPFQEVSNNLQYVFLFREAEKPLMIELMKALNGDKYNTFNGLEKFKLPRITPRENLVAIRISEFSDEEIERAIAEIPKQGNRIVISVFPRNEERFYYSLKNRCLKDNILLQVVHNETILNEYIFKWSVSSIGLQIFSKLGGTPWLVKSNQQKTLMIGVGHSQSRNPNTNQIQRFYAYSILVESTGKFVSIKPLANHSDKSEYLNEIASNVGALIEENQSYSKIVFHLPYKIKQEEIDIIKKAIQEKNNAVEVTLIRINDSSKFLGFNTLQNSLAPYESTYAALSFHEFLVWTEGLNFHSPNANKRYAHPLLIEFLYPKGKEVNHSEYLQEILNLSGANFRGFNAKALPVSLFYPKLISEFNKNFNDFNLEQVITDNNKPWFL